LPDKASQRSAAMLGNVQASPKRHAAPRESLFEAAIHAPPKALAVRLEARSNCG
jgi:hypothetical protein